MDKEDIFTGITILAVVLAIIVLIPLFSVVINITYILILISVYMMISGIKYGFALFCIAIVINIVIHTVKMILELVKLCVGE